MNKLPTREQVKGAAQEDWDDWAGAGNHVAAVVDAYISGRLIDGQAIADAWNAAGQTFPTLPQDPPARGRETVRIFWPELASAIEDALTEKER